MASFSCQPEESLLRFKGLPGGLLSLQVPVALQLFITSPGRLLPLASLRALLWAQDPPPIPYHTKFAGSFFHLHCSVSPSCLLIWDGSSHCFPISPCQNRPPFPASSSQHTAKLPLFPLFSPCPTSASTFLISQNNSEKDTTQQ